MKIRTNSAYTLIEIMVVVAIIGLLTGIALPNIRQAIIRTQTQSCQLNRKNIDAAKVQWALVNCQPLTALPTDQDLFGAKAFIEHKPDCPAGGNYKLKTVEEHCTCDVLKHVNQLVP